MSIYLGIGLALCSTLCSSAGYTLNKLAHKAAAAASCDKPQTITLSGQIITPSGESVGPEDANPGSKSVDRFEPLSPPSLPPAPAQPPQKKTFWSFWQFYAGLALLVAGVIFSAFVFGLAPQSTLAPLGSVTMILTTIFSWKFLGESFTEVDAVSVGLMATGTTLAILFGKAEDPKYTLEDIEDLFVDRSASWLLASFTGLAIAFATHYILTTGRAPVSSLTRSQASLDMFCRSFVAAAWSGYSNFASKAVVEVVFASVSDHSARDWADPGLYLLALITVASLLMQVRFLNMGLAKYDAMIVVRLYQAMLAIFSILSGFFYFDEIEEQSAGSIVMFCVGAAIVITGMVFGMRRRPSPECASASADSNALPIHHEDSNGDGIGATAPAGEDKARLNVDASAAGEWDERPVLVAPV